MGSMGGLKTEAIHLGELVVGAEVAGFFVGEAVQRVQQLIFLSFKPVQLLVEG